MFTSTLPHNSELILHQPDSRISVYIKLTQSAVKFQIVFFGQNASEIKDIKVEVYKK